MNKRMTQITGIILCTCVAFSAITISHKADVFATDVVESQQLDSSALETEVVPADVMEVNDPISESIITEVPVPEPEPVITETPAPESEPVITEAPASESEPVITEAPAPEPEPVITEAPVPEPEAVITEAPAPEPEPVITKAPAPEPEPIITGTPTPEHMVTETPTPEQEISETPDADDKVVEEVSGVEKNFYIISEIPENAVEGDMMKLRCVLEGYEEGTYSLQWQYRETDWFGNYESDWIDQPNATETELSLVINDDNVLRVWRVNLTEYI